jgi:hypothetical protein
MGAGRYAQAYHRFIQQPRMPSCSPLAAPPLNPFDLIAKLIGADNHKQLPIQRLPNVRTCIALATFALNLL